MLGRRFLAAAMWVFLGLACSESSPSSARSPEFQKAQTALENAISETLDPSYAAPAFDDVEALFRQVPSSAPDYQLAQGIAKEIHEQRTKAKADQALRESHAEKAKEAAEQASKSYVAERRARQAAEELEERRKAREEAKRKQEEAAAAAKQGSENPAGSE